MSYEASQVYLREQAEARRQRTLDKRETLQRLCSRLPATHSTWDALRVSEYRAATQKAMRVLNNSRSTEQALNDAIAAVQQFYT